MNIAVKTPLTKKDETQFTAYFLTELENETELGEFRFQFDDIHLWPLVRFQLFFHCYREIEGIEFSAKAPTSGADLDSQKSQLAKLSCQSIEDTIAQLPVAKVLIFSQEHYRKYVNEKLHNTQQMMFSALEVDSVVVEDAFLNAEQSGWFWHDLLFQYGRLKAREIKPSPMDKVTIDAFVEYLREKYKQWVTDELLQSIQKNLEAIATRLPYWKQCFVSLVRKINPKLVMMENGSYGARGYQLAWLHELGIRVCEMQHGQIDNHVLAYIVNPELLSSSWYSRYIPNDFLCWSEHWAEKFQGGATSHVIGHCEYQKIKESFNYQPEYILFCSNGIDIESTKAWLIKLIERFPDYPIKIRMHPTMRRFKGVFEKVLSDQYIDTEPSETLVSNLERALVTISEPSTVLYESYALGVPTYLLNLGPWDDFPELPIIKDLLNLAELPMRKVTWQEDHERLFGSDWRKNLTRYLNSEVVGLHE